MQPNELPIVVIPLELPAEAADTLIAFLYDLAEAIERHYAPAIMGRAQQQPVSETPHAGAAQLTTPREPPF